MVVIRNMLLAILIWCSAIDRSCAMIYFNRHEGVQNSVDVQRTLRVLAINNPPFIGFGAHSIGIDMLILQAIARKLNLTIQLNKVHTLDSKIIKQKSEKHDIIIGGLRRNQIKSKEFVPSSIYFQDDVILCVKQAQHYPQWANVFFIVKDIQTWVYGGIFFSWATFLLYLMVALEPKPMDAWKTIIFALQTMLGVPASTFKPLGGIIRILYFATLYVQVLIVTLYNAYFFTFITRRIQETQISTVDEIITLNYRIHGIQATINELNEFNVTSRFAGVNVCENLEICLNQLQHQHKVAVAMSRLYFDTSNHSNIYCFDRTQDLHTYSIVFMIRRGLLTFNEFMDTFNHLSMSGLIPKWTRDLHIRKETIEHSSHVKSLGMQEAFGPFALCCLILMLAFIAAISEQIIFRQLTKNPKSRFWQIAEKCIDGKRHYMLWNKRNVESTQYADVLIEQKNQTNQRILTRTVNTKKGNRTRFEFVWRD